MTFCWTCVTPCWRHRIPNAFCDAEAPEAFSLADSTGDSPRAVRACSAALFAMGTELGGVAYRSPQWVEWAGRIDRCAGSDTVERATADWALGLMKYARGEIPVAQELYARAYETACRFKDALAISLAGTVVVAAYTAPHRAAERLRVTEDMWARLRPVLTVRSGFHSLAYIGDAFLFAGRRNDAEEVFAALRGLATRSGNKRIEFDSQSMDLVLAVMDGRLEEATNMAESIQARSQEAGLPDLGTFAVYSQARANVYLGLPIEPLLAKVGPVVRSLMMPVGLAHSGRIAEAKVDLEKSMSLRQAGGREVPALADMLILEASILTQHRQAAEEELNLFAGNAIRTSGTCFTTVLARHLGGAAAFLERFDKARQHYQEAIRVCTEMRFRPELALSRLQLAELLLDHYPEEKKDALDHLDFAIKEFREMKMRPSLERALRRKEILRA